MMVLEGRSKSIFIVTLIFLCLSLTTVVLRCYVRLRLVRRFGWDDALMVLAMALYIWFAICGLAGSLAGIGKRLDEFDRPQEIQRALLWWWLGQSAYVWVVMVARLSIAMLLLRISTRRRDSILTYVVMGLTVATGLPFWLLLMLQCRPVEEFWQRTGNGYCINMKYLLDIAYLYSATACVCDFALGLYPIYLLRNLRMSRQSKWALAAILGLGCVTSAAVVVRIPFIPDYLDVDFLYTTSGIAISSNVEAGLGITAGSLVTLRPLRHGFDHISRIAHRGCRKLRGKIALSGSDRSHNAPVALDPSWPGGWRLELEPGEAYFISTSVTSQNSQTRSIAEDQTPHGRINVERTIEISG